MLNIYRLLMESSCSNLFIGMLMNPSCSTIATIIVCSHASVAKPSSIYKLIDGITIVHPKCLHIFIGKSSSVTKASILCITYCNSRLVDPYQYVNLDKFIPPVSYVPPDQYRMYRWHTYFGQQEQKLRDNIHHRYPSLRLSLYLMMIMGSFRFHCLCQVCNCHMTPKSISSLLQ